MRRLKIVTELKQTLSDRENELSLHYQPIISIISDEITHIEALLRWENESLGHVSPAEFIPLAEEAGVVNAITLWVIRRVAVDQQRLEALGLNINISVNISAHDLMIEDFVDEALNIFGQYNIDASKFTFELTETSFVENAAIAEARLAQLKKAGTKLALDDFGTGYSSLSYLPNLSLDIIKIDKSFVIGLSDNTGSQKICGRIIELSKDFGFEVIAEGVEEEESLRILRDWHCDLAQGYFMHKPMSFTKFVSLLQKT